MKNTKSLDNLRRKIHDHYFIDEKEHVCNLLKSAAHIKDSTRDAIKSTTQHIVLTLRSDNSLSKVDSFIKEYNLSNEEGIAIFSMAESLLRVPDNKTIDKLIEDKIASGNWRSHSGNSESLFVNLSTWGFLFAHIILKAECKEVPSNELGVLSKIYEVIRSTIKRMSAPIIRGAILKAMTILGGYFVLGVDIKAAIRRSQELIDRGFTYSYDMLAEAAETEEDALRYFQSYQDALEEIGSMPNDNIYSAPGSISIKLSALVAGYKFAKKEILFPKMYSRLKELCLKAKHYNIMLFIDAEEAERLEFSLDIIEALSFDQDLNGWLGLGAAVQAYQKRALAVLEWFSELAAITNRRWVIRLVKGAYWDTEIKLAQERGINYPVFTRRAHTDLSYLVCSKYLLNQVERFYPCFATHNAHSIATIMELANKNSNFEFQRLHGMGEKIYDYVIKQLAPNLHCRIYAPVGSYKDLLPYLIRRLQENGANSSFVNRLNDSNVTIDKLIADPIEKALRCGATPHPEISSIEYVYSKDRKTAKGLLIADRFAKEELDYNLNLFSHSQIVSGPIINGKELFKNKYNITSPADRSKIIGENSNATPEDAAQALEIAHNFFSKWSQVDVEVRANFLERAADLFEGNYYRLLSILVNEAGKMINDAVAEIREAIDFLRYYAQEARKSFKWRPLAGPVGEDNQISLEGKGVFLCISPWNFPLAIFIGQISAALVAGNTVLAKPAEQTPLIASEAIKLLLEAGIPAAALHLLPGDGPTLGQVLISDQRVVGVAFTGSTETAHIINKILSNRPGFIPTFIAETGGINAMVVDSTALAEHVARDSISSGFQSAGQRCSALRLLLIQEEVADTHIHMLIGAMQEIVIGDPSSLSTDVGPVIDQEAHQMLTDYISNHPGRLLYKKEVPAELNNGYFFAPHLIELESIHDLHKEIFGPIVHVVRYKSSEVDQIIDDINKSGYGLTFALQTRIYDNIDYFTHRINAGNIYVNRNQIGAVVGSQPFGGRGLSGTGFKAGGPYYLYRFAHEKVLTVNSTTFCGQAALMCLSDD